MLLLTEKMDCPKLRFSSCYWAWVVLNIILPYRTLPYQPYPTYPVQLFFVLVLAPAPTAANTRYHLQWILHPCRLCCFVLLLLLLMLWSAPSVCFIPECVFGATATHSCYQLPVPVHASPSQFLVVLLLQLVLLLSLAAYTSVAPVALFLCVLSLCTAIYALEYYTVVLHRTITP